MGTEGVALLAEEIYAIVSSIYPLFILPCYSPVLGFCSTTAFSK